MIESTSAMVRRARAEGYAIPAVNVFDEISMRAVIEAARKRNAPLIIQISTKTVRSAGCDLITAMFNELVGNPAAPVALHLDHCPDRAVLDEVIAAKWSSVLFDASDRDLATADRETAEVVAQAHANGVEVESEIENIIGVEDGVGSDVAKHSYTVAQLVDVANRTGTDMLAPQLGTAHGMYNAAPVLVPERVREIVELTDKPVVLHGGTGLSDEDFRAFIDAGVGKINISTAVKMAYMKAAAKHLAKAEATNKWDPPSMFRDITEAIDTEIGGFIDTFGAADKAVWPDRL